MKSNFILFKTYLLFSCFLLVATLEAKEMRGPISLQDNTKLTCKIKVLKSTGEVQRNVYAKIFGQFDKHEADENGVINLEYVSSNYTHSVTLYFKGDQSDLKKSINLDEQQKEITVYFDSLEDILDYKRSGRLFPIEGIVVDQSGNPLEGAMVSIQGTGRRTMTDEIGLFNIDADFNHPIIIRADGMNNLSYPLTRFLQFHDKENIITMNKKNSYAVYSSVEKMPEYPGGMKAFQEYLDLNLEYPSKAKEAKIEGVVVIQFVVEKDGSIDNPVVARHLETTLDSAAWRVIRDMPRWIPASDYGTKVRCKFSLPVAFKIPEPKPVPPTDSTNLVKDSLSLSTDRLLTSRDTITSDSLSSDSTVAKEITKSNLLLKGDSIHRSMPVDSLQQDSTRATVQDHPIVKAKKRNIFVRFFRWLFGIERRQRKRAEQEQIQSKSESDSLQLDSKKVLTISPDSMLLETDTLDIHRKDLEKNTQE